MWLMQQRFYKLLSSSQAIDLLHLYPDDSLSGNLYIDQGFSYSFNKMGIS
jgi:hypothetical protein